MQLVLQFTPVFANIIQILNQIVGIINGGGSMRTRYWKILIFSFIVFCIWRRGWMQTANVVISSFPSVVQQGEPFNVSVDYIADLYQYGLAARIFLEVIDAESHKVLQTIWNDNNRQCYEGPNGQLTFSCSVAGANAIYFNAYISPVEFNNWFINEFQSYPTDGTYPYKWEGNGITHDIYYQGTLILADNVPGNYCYCSGITFQVFMDAYQKYNDYWGYSSIYGLTPAQISAFRREWYGIYSRRCAVEAITKYKIGYEIPYTQKEKVRRGDDVQLWRWNGSGHSVIFDSWVRDSANNIIGLNYWSTQSSTNGIGYRTEYFGTGTGLKDNECYYARKVKPVDGDDWFNRYGDDNTLSLIHI
ncbi:MAG: hypothetical protein N2246_04105, partial [Candidatus Sumerlaeia bacterium]|nr:hypothetical protein [Candidatus Sumerlaeia bacterium]